MSAFVASDHHFGHKNIINFKRADGSPLRDFSSMEEMHETIINNHNSVVKQNDTTYFLGDVVINNKHGFPILAQLNGKKKLIMGNHDIFQLAEYQKYFYDIRAYRVWPEHGIIASHMPIHENQLVSRWKLNIHGHGHEHWVMKDGVRDPRYFNCCTEEHAYTPIPFETIIALLPTQNDV